MSDILKELTYCLWITFLLFMALVGWWYLPLWFFVGRFA